MTAGKRGITPTTNLTLDASTNTEASSFNKVGAKNH
jgi:hypothetical protein